MVEWSDENFSTGYDVIDNENRKIIDLVNRLIDGLKRGELEKSIKETITYLEVCAVDSFRQEEQIMKETKCKAYSINKKEHLAFETRLYNFKMQFDREGYNKGNLKEFINFVSSWIFEHIQNIDTMLKTTLENPLSGQAD